MNNIQGYPRLTSVLSSFTLINFLTFVHMPDFGKPLIEYHGMVFGPLAQQP